MRRTSINVALAIGSILLATPLIAQEEGGGMDFGDGSAPPAEPETSDPSSTPEGETPAAPEPEFDKSALDEGIDLTLKDRIKAVSRKVFLKMDRFELTPGMAVTTNDPFFRTWAVAGRAAYHLNDSFSVEVGGAYVPPYFKETLPALDLLREQARLINADADLIGIVDAGVTFSPIYGKLALMSDAIIHVDVFAIAGGGAVFDEGKDFVHPTMDIGAGLRVFLLRWLVVRADLRDYVYPQDARGISTLQNLLMLNVGVGFYLPFDFQYRYEAARVRS